MSVKKKYAGVNQASSTLFTLSCQYHNWVKNFWKVGPEEIKKHIRNGAIRALSYLK